jgi:outer membrane protein OmpA-like peptidoglycan-associated protein
VNKKIVMAAALAALPATAQAQAQSLQYAGFYVGAVGGLNWLFNNTHTGTATTPRTTSTNTSTSMYNTGFAAGGMIGYDFLGPRLEIEGLYRENRGTATAPAKGIVPNEFRQISAMANVLYDFNAGGTIVPYIGAGAGIAFITSVTDGTDEIDTQFAYQAIVGVGYNIDPTFRLNLEGRYYGTTNPTFRHSSIVSGGTRTAINSRLNNDMSVMASLQVRFGVPAAAPPPPTSTFDPSFIVFFDWDRSTLSQQALNTIRQAANAFNAKGSARITATGHADRSGPEAYNMALSLRRANAVKDALVRDGVPAAAIAVIGKGETQPLVPTADGVRELQNRRVEIVLQ